MKIQVVAQNKTQVQAFLIEEAGVLQVDGIAKIDQVVRWHDDVWKHCPGEKLELGELWNRYGVELQDCCQEHIDQARFESDDLEKLEENCLYILRKSFCTLCDRDVETQEHKCQYIIA